MFPLREMESAGAPYDRAGVVSGETLLKAERVVEVATHRRLLHPGRAVVDRSLQTLYLRQRTSGEHSRGQRDVE
jgi:hypothetical protein